MAKKAHPHRLNEKELEEFVRLVRALNMGTFGKIIDAQFRMLRNMRRQIYFLRSKRGGNFRVPRKLVRPFRARRVAA